MSRIRALLLDLDDTLLDDRSAAQAGFEALAAAFPPLDPQESHPVALARWRTLSDLHWSRYEAGEWTFQEQRRARIREFLGKPLDDDQADLTWEVYRTAYEAAWRVFPEAREFLEKTARIPKILVTNGDRAQQHLKLARTGLAAWFLRIVTPEDAGAWKPDARIFLHAKTLLDAEVPELLPEEVLAIGDDSFRDLEPARALGMEGIQVVPGDSGRSWERVLARISF